MYKSALLKKSYFSTKTYAGGTQKNRLNESSFEHPKQMFKVMDKKIFTILHLFYLSWGLHTLSLCIMIC